MSRAASALVVRREALRPPGSPELLEPRAESARGRWRGAWPLLFAFALYSVIALAFWWRLIAHGFGVALPAGSADPGQEVWFLAWVPHALGAGLDPFFSHAVFARAGVNLLDNTSMELLGLLFAPITVTAGPIATLDVAVLLAPVLSALGAFTLCRRYVSWPPAAFVGGLCYGFGPFLTGDLRYGHLDLTWLALPPLIFCCLDALVIRGTARPLLVGGALGALVVAQFFVSTEVLAIAALMAAALAVLVALGWRQNVVPHLVAAWRGLGLAALIVVVVLAYPVWFVVAGPRHVSGPVWQDIGGIATSLAATVEPHGELTKVAFVSGSNGGYLGVSLLIVLVVGAIVLWRSSVLRVALIAALLAYIASLGYELHVGHRPLHISLPAVLLGHVPLLDSIVPERFAAMVDLFCSLGLATIIEHVRHWDRPRRNGATGRHLRAPFDVHARATTPPVPLLSALAVAIGAFAVVPFVAAAHWPYAVTTVPQPAAILDWSSGVARAVDGTSPVFAMYPDAPTSTSDEMVWQAQDDFSFSLAEGYAIVPGPGRHAVESPPIDALWLVFAAASVHRLDLPLTHTTKNAVRGDLHALNADDVVVFAGAAGSSAVRRALREVLGTDGQDLDGTVRWQVGRR